MRVYQVKTSISADKSSIIRFVTVMRIKSLDPVAIRAICPRVQYIKFRGYIYQSITIKEFYAMKRSYKTLYLARSISEKTTVFLPIIPRRYAYNLKRAYWEAEIEVFIRSRYWLYKDAGMLQWHRGFRIAGLHSLLFMSLRIHLSSIPQL